jgi:hypothetical protein
MPPGGTGIPKMQTGVEGHKGIGWAFSPVKPSTGLLAHFLKLFEAATRNEDTKKVAFRGEIAKPKSREVNYYAHQIAMLQGGGKWMPASDGTALNPDVDGNFVAAMAKYREGDDDAALAELKKIVAAKLKVSVQKVEQMSKGEIEGHLSANGAGHRRTHRINWTRATLKKLFGNVLPSHRLLSAGGVVPAPTFFDHVKNNGAVMANNMRPFAAAKQGGSSVSSDFNAGGSQGVFGGFRDLGYGGANILHFDWSVLLRTDVYVVSSGDGYGNVNYERITDPKKWKKWTESHSTTSELNSGSHYQINFRHDVDLRTYLHTCVCSNESDVKAVRKICEEMGWTTFAQGRPLNKVIVTKGKVSI